MAILFLHVMLPVVSPLLPVLPIDEPAYDETQLRWLIRAERVKDLPQELAKAGGFGPEAVKLYIRLIDGSDDAFTVAKVLGIITFPEMKEQRGQFLDRVLDKLSDPRNGVRRTAVQALSEIGTVRDTTPVAVLLCDPDPSVTYYAARTLAAIGDERSVTALGIWLKRGNHRDDERLLRHVETAQADLKERLDKEKQEKAKKPPAK